MLGETSIAREKLQHGNPLPVLGVSVEMNLGGISFIPEPEKLEKYRQQIMEAIRTMRLSGGEAAKLAGSPMLHSITLSLFASSYFMQAGWASQPNALSGD